MKNKILGSIVLVIAIIGIIISVLLIPQLGEFGWPMLGGSLFLVLIGVVVYRKGIKGAAGAIYDGTPKTLR